MQAQLNNQYSEQDASNMISQKAFSGFQKLIFDSAGITMSDAKKSLISGRLGKRVRLLNLQSYDEYLSYLTKGEGAKNSEFQLFIDLLTTNETYFFREPQHFDFLRQQILKKHDSSNVLKIWSAASSSGEEAYTLSMILADEFGIDGNWEILGTDISTKMIRAAKNAIYSEHRVRLVPDDCRKRYLLKGTGKQKGNVAVVPELKKHVRFEHYNLVESALRRELFDVIFCRNVLIYFSQDTKKIVMRRLLKQLKNNAYLMTGHSESLHGMIPELISVQPSVYLKGGA